MSLKPGAVVFMLHYEGEGAYLAWFKGRLLSVDIGMGFGWPSPTGEPDRPRIRIDSEPETEWWANVELESGKTGWTDAPKKFQGIDACGGPPTGTLDP